MKQTMLALPVLLLTLCSGVFGAPDRAAQDSATTTDQCFACHTTFSDKPSSQYTHDIHHLK